MNLKKVFCWHDYELWGYKKNFYGMVERLCCKKCGKIKNEITGYPEMGLRHESKYWTKEDGYFDGGSVRYERTSTFRNH